MEQRKVGMLIITIGLFLLLINLGFIPGNAFLAILGLAFIVVYIALGGRKKYGNIGFLIPGCVLLAINSFIWINQNYIGNDLGGMMFFICLGAAFLVVLLSHTIWFTELNFGDRFWPIFPGAGLILFGTLVIGFKVNFNIINYLIIIAMIVTGLSLMVTSKSKKM